VETFSTAETIDLFDRCREWFSWTFKTPQMSAK